MKARIMAMILSRGRSKHVTLRYRNEWGKGKGKGKTKETKGRKDATNIK